MPPTKCQREDLRDGRKGERIKSLAIFVFNSTPPGSSMVFIIA